MVITKLLDHTKDKPQRSVTLLPTIHRPYRALDRSHRSAPSAHLGRTTAPHAGPAGHRHADHRPVRRDPVIRRRTQSDAKLATAWALASAAGGCSWVAASHTTAAVRMAKSLATPIPTPVAMAQLNASTDGVRRSAKTSGGGSFRNPLQLASRNRRAITAASAPAP
jgi:hypothetical protein